MPIATLTINVNGKEASVHFPVKQQKQWNIEFIKDYDNNDLNIPPGTKRTLYEDPSEHGFSETSFDGDQYFVSRKYYKITGFSEVYVSENKYIDLRQLLTKLSG